jgi:protein gp37
MEQARRLKRFALADIAHGRNPGRKRHYIDVVGDDGRWNGKVVLVPEALADPLKWKRPRKVFVNSMSDLFHERLSIEAIRKVLEVMAEARQHTYQVLTKRAERMRELLSGPLREFAELGHILWGVSVENVRHGLPRVELLRQTPAAVRFLSIEPLLEDLGDLDLMGIAGVIVGGESGQHHRLILEGWVQSILRQCEAHGVKFFFKQWGGRYHHSGGRLLNGRTYDEMPERLPLPLVTPEYCTPSTRK